MKTRTYTLTCLLSLLVLGLTACGPTDGPDSADTTGTTPAGSVSMSSFLLADAPESAPGLIEGLQSLATGDTVFVSGRVGGVLKPISEDFAGFVMADEVLEFCDEMAGESHCATPWDACCEDPEKIQSARAFVQFVDAAGDPIPVNLRDAVRLAENDTVIVRGKLSPDSTADNRIILAKGLAIVPQVHSP